jgi:alginate O-acetyltransferase complex protein AlgI
MQVIGLIVAAAAVLALAAATWRRRTRLASRAVLAILAALGISVAASGTLLSALWLALDVVLIVITWALARSGHMAGWIGVAWIVLLVLALLIAKLPPLQTIIGAGVWIGVSYLIFRLIHVSLDARRNRLGDEALPETLVYALHPATLIAGPIDRVQHNISEQRCAPEQPSLYVSDGLWRVFIGLFKKAALANLFYAFVQAHDMVAHPDQPTGVAWLWLLAFSLYLYFDFAAYSDLAIGLGRLMGLRLPENFANPYVQPTVTRFWQAWHITLSNWLRDYIFFPLSRGLLKRYGSRYSTPILFASHLTTMIACGLWHGIGSGFVTWGAWHGLGLFAHSQLPALRRRFNLPVIPQAPSIVLTFCFVTLGWVFFAADLPTALRIFGRLFGVSR